jgi:hypothetical protein
MAVEVSTVGSLEALVGGLAVSIICDLDDVLVLRAGGVSSHNGTNVGHTVTDLRHSVLFSVLVACCHLEGGLSLVFHEGGEALDLVIGFLLVEVGLGHSHELVSVSRSRNLLAILGICLLSTSTMSG